MSRSLRAVVAVLPLPDLSDRSVMNAKDIEDFKGHPEHWKK